MPYINIELRLNLKVSIMRKSILMLITVLLLIQGYLFVNIVPSSLGLLLLLYMLSLYISHNPKVSIELEETYFEIYDDESIKIRFLINNQSNILIRIQALKTSSDFEWETPSKIIKKDRNAIYEITLTPKSKGHFKIDEFKFEIGGANKIHTEIKSIMEKVIINVYPSPKSISEGVSRDINLTIGEEILRLIKVGPKSSEVEIVREFMPGDSIKDIDWKKSSIRGELYVKEYLRELEGDVYILLDVDNEFKRKIVNRSKVDYIMLLIGQLLYITNLKSNRKLKVILFNNFGVVKVIDRLNSIKSILKKISPYMVSSRGYSNFKIYLKSLLKVSSPLFRITDDFSKLSLEMDKGAVFIITDAGLRYSEIKSFAETVKKKNISVYVISLNPYLFIDIDKIPKKNTLKICYKYKEREKVINKLNITCPTVDIGPNDVIGLLFKEGNS